MYSKKTIDHFRNPKYAGEMEDPDGVGEEGNMKCGDMMKISIKVKDDRIDDIRFQTYGCIAAIASTDMLCEMAKGKALEEAEKITAKDVSEELGELPSIKLHCSMMGHEALKNAIRDYREKRR